MAIQSKKKIKRWLTVICLAILIIIGIFIVCYILVIGNQQKPVYVVIIDAGSTGSRVSAFTFHKTSLNGSLMLDSEYFAEIKPGLSSFADDPVKGAQFLQILVDKAKASVPKSEWGHTLFRLKATAGLRLLPQEKADRLLKECEKLFDKSGFLITEQSVSIMNGRDEGIFSWLTVNFLLDRLTAQSHENTVAALDLGGGSAQVTFVPDDEHVKDQKKYIFTINAFTNNISIYTQSYLGMGLMAARKEILTSGENVDKKEENGSPESAIEVYSECINPIISTKWNYGGVDYLVKGPKNGTHKVVGRQNFTGINEDKPVVRFSDCLRIVKNYVNTIVDKPVGLETREITAFSYYFDRATEVGLIDPLNGGIVPVEAFLREAVNSCDYPNTDQPFMCLDLLFIHVLLRDGFNLQPTTKLQIYRKINGHDVSWALGAAFSVLQNEL